MRIPNIFFNTKSNYKYSYYELGLNNKKGSYLEISIDENTATIEIDRYSSIPIYYIIFKGCLYASTKIDSLVNSAPSDFKLEISSLGISTFIKTNTLMDNLTFFNNIKKIPYGCKLVFNKEKKNIKIFKHWNLAINCNNQNDHKNLLNYNEILRYSLNKYLEKEKNKKIGLNLSGGYDSRLLLGYLSKFNPKIFSYNFTYSPEINIVKKLSENLELDLKVFQNLNFYSKYEEQIFTNTDYMMSLLHGHCFPTILKQKKSVNSVFYGHFIDMHSQSHQYNSFFFNEKNKKKIKNKLFELWCNNKSVFSIINLNTFNFLVKKGNTENYKNFIEKQLDTYSNFDGNYQYDINYFVHHGLRRAMAQLQLGANFLEFYTPALHADFFDFVWSIPHKIKRKRNFQEMIMRTYHESLMENEYILDNYKINYLGKNFFKRFIFKSRMILKHKKISLLKPFYDSWGDVVPSLFKIELNKFYCEDIMNNEALLDHQIFNNDNLISFLKNEQNINKPNMSIIFSLYTVSKFIKKYFG